MPPRSASETTARIEALRASVISKKRAIAHLRNQLRADATELTQLELQQLRPGDVLVLSPKA